MSAQLASVTTYRKLDNADLDRVLSIENAVHLHPWTRGNFSDSIDAGYHCWIAERDMQIVGYGIVMIAAGEAHLLNLSVATQWQRAARPRSHTFFLKLARDYGADASTSRSGRRTRVRARVFGQGFEEVGVRRDYYPASAAGKMQWSWS